MWEFSTEPEFQETLDWMERFVREEVEPLDLLFGGPGQVDGSTEVHQVTVARQLLRRYSPAGGLFPGEHIPPKLAAAREKYAPVLREFAQ